jgi:hypothetical protein
MIINVTKSADLDILRNFTDEALEGEFSDQEIRRLLVPSDLPEGYSPRTETMGLLWRDLPVGWLAPTKKKGGEVQ